MTARQTDTNLEGPGRRGRRGAGQGPFVGPGGGPGGGQGLGPDPGPGGGRYRRAVLETSLLASLAESTAHGYDLVEQIDELAADLVCIDPGSMYRLLRGLEEQGLVSSTWQTPEAGPSRRMYVITERGLEALDFMARSLSMRANAMHKLAEHAAQAAARAREGRPEDE